MIPVPLPCSPCSPSVIVSSDHSSASRVVRCARVRSCAGTVGKGSTTGGWIGGLSGRVHVLGGLGARTGGVGERKERTEGLEVRTEGLAERKKPPRPPPPKMLSKKDELCERAEGLVARLLLPASVRVSSDHARVPSDQIDSEPNVSVRSRSKSKLRTGGARGCVPRDPCEEESPRKSTWTVGGSISVCSSSRSRLGVGAGALVE